jgi:hypothetical protein
MTDETDRQAYSKKSSRIPANSKQLQALNQTPFNITFGTAKGK